MSSRKTVLAYIGSHGPCSSQGIEAASSDWWPGALQNILAECESSGLITSKLEDRDVWPRRKLYQLTDAGRARK